MPSFTVSVPYPGGILSVNRFKPDGRHTDSGTTAWMRGLTLLVRTETNRRGLKPQAPVTIAVKGFFRDGRSCPDVHNLAKVVLDGIEEAWIRPDGLGPLINDREFRFVDLGYSVGHAEAKLEIAVSW